MHEEVLLQTYSGLKTIFPKDSPVTVAYNDSLRELVVASKKISILKCQPTINLEETDGFTHMTPVSFILLNELYNFLVTCSISSVIIIWDVWRGRKINLISQAHTQVKHGEVQLVGIFTKDSVCALSALAVG